MLWLYRLLSRITPNDVPARKPAPASGLGGRMAPDFALPADDGATVRLRELRGRPVVLFFYPKDDSPT
jgi:hypothetical protein